MPIRLRMHCLSAVAISILLVGPQSCFAQINNPRNVILGPTTSQIHTLAQNWSHAEAEELLPLSH